MNLKNEGGYFALLVKTVKQNYDAVALLLEKHAKVDLQHDFIGYTALMSSCYDGFYSLAMLLLDHGANPNIQDKIAGNSALHIAQSLGSVKLIKLLLDRGADPNLQDNHGKDALIHASELTNTKVQTIDLILKASNSSRTDIFRALQRAVECKNTSVAYCLFGKCLTIIKQIFQFNGK